MELTPANHKGVGSKDLQTKRKASSKESEYPLQYAKIYRFFASEPKGSSPTLGGRNSMINQPVLRKELLHRSSALANEAHRTLQGSHHFLAPVYAESMKNGGMDIMRFDRTILRHNAILVG